MVKLAIFHKRDITSWAWDEILDEFEFDFEFGINLVKDLIQHGRAQISIPCVHCKDAKFYTIDALEGKEVLVENAHLNATMEIVDGTLSVIIKDLKSIRVLMHKTNEDDWL